MNVVNARRGSSDGGFTLIEVIVAMFITLIVMTAMMGVIVSSLSTIAQAKQRQTATSLATQSLERLRALPYDAVTQPDGSAPETGIAFVTDVSGVRHFTPTAVLPGFDEVLVVNNPGTWSGSGQFDDVTIGSATYRVSTYVSKPPTTPAGQQTFTATAIVTWTSSVSHGTRRVVEQSTLYSPAGCLSTAQSPFAAPCQSYFTAHAGQVLSSLSVTNPTDSTLPIEGFGASDTKLEIGFPSNDANLLIEQTASGNAGATTEGVAVSGTTPQGSAVASAAVDSDPSSTPGQSETVTTPGYASSSLSATGSAGQLIVTPAGTNTGGAASAIAAPSALCVGVSGSGLITGDPTTLRPCSSSWVQPGSGTSSLVYKPAWGSGPPLSVATFDGESTPARSVAAQLTKPNADACTGGSGPSAVGCAYGAASREVGTVQLGLASGASSVPAGFGGGPILTVSGLEESVRAEEGQGGREPLYSRSGAVRVWDGSTYQDIDLADYSDPAGSPAGATVNVPPTAFVYPAASGDVTLTYEGVVSVQRPQVTRTQSGATRTASLVADCKAKACTTEVNGGGVVTATFTVTVQRGGLQVAQFGMSTSLGGLVSEASYKVAANG
ncbi:prepilin-type N-terminal cleavage/methylation domain-containing protein [Cellulomonas sp. Leaf395]|uniref:prepilin-type N-terminal cleavage/methylation domain-containing protein n=1 Tax=Cellulomonas sp. Leaf395 TaxID=1736362 RepID=UPI0006F626CC|nr:prepilin-type N-terminal cleavage/methylation domain-containing protein [Cellulomonas sp. Leaf395]KQS97204.1 hypothetical protein ASG23_16695 [Cellulomonas sp. Leaf395]